MGHLPEGNPPHSAEAERAVIGCALIDPRCLDTVDLTPDEFFTPQHRDVWTVVRDLHSRGAYIDPVVVWDAIKSRGLSHSFDCTDSAWLVKTASEAPLPIHAGEHAQIVRDKASLRKLIRTCADVMLSAYGNGDPEELLGEARQAISDLERSGANGGPIGASESIQAVLDVIEDRAKAPDGYRISTGIRAFDGLTGGLKRGHLVVVAGSPGMGKTAWAGNVAAHNSLAGVPSLLFSLEMDRQEMLERFLAHTAHIPAIKLATGEVRADSELWDSVKWAAERIKGAKLWVDDRELSLAQVCGTARKWHARNVAGKGLPMGVIFVDYIGLIRSEGRQENRNLEISAMTRALKMLARSLRIPVVLLSQLNRDRDRRGGHPQLSDLRDSGAIGQDADMVIFPWREFPKDEEGNDIINSSGPAEWIIGKHRGGPRGNVRVHWEAQWMGFENV